MPKARRTIAPQRVVGIGASAGGLDALKQLVARLPRHNELAFVVLQHLPPSQTGQLARLLANVTELPVIDVKTGHRVTPDTILVVPPRTSAALVRGALVLRRSTAPARPNLPIDELFVSLAAALGERAIGVVLSGSAHDGTEGLRAIQAAGGLTFAQDPSTAQFDEMPRSAVAAGVAERVIPPAEIGEELAAVAKLATRRKPPAPPQPSPIDRVLGQLREASGIDFTSYKRTTIERRLARRVAKLRLGSLANYSAHLDAHPDEARAVYEDLLIHVTEFFRDALAFDRLVARAVSLVGERSPEIPVRVWVPGCSTGEEVYSLAILLIEALGEQRSLQLFGSDLSARAIDTARAGRYPETIAARVGAERLARFFHREDGAYRIRRDVREKCVFVRHDLVTDPPISRLDIVSCRNVLIYLGPELQQRAIPIFHYALNQPGFLLLGRAETIGGFEALFDPVDADVRLYVRKPAVREGLTFPLARQLGRTSWQPWRPGDAPRPQLDLKRDVDHVLLARYAPACVLVDDHLDVVQFRGRTGPYLEAPSGQPQINLLRMAREGLGSELTIAIRRARAAGGAVRKENLAVREGGHERRFHLEVVPVGAVAGARRHFLIVFEPAGALPASPRRSASKPPRESSELAHVRRELDETKEYLAAVVGQHHATSEELGIANEELQSTNEELQSTNEELQTAKEELESTNEELETVNEELRQGSAKLHEANDDLLNVLASVEIAIIMVDTERCVRRFTPKARAVMKLIPGDIGRPIADLKPSIAVPGLDDAIANAIETLVVHESEVESSDHMTYRMTIRPYRTADHKISGAVIAFVDITALRAARDYAAAIVEAVRLRSS